MFDTTDIQNCEILIVGAGPAGLTAASELVRQGVRSFLIIEQLLEPVIASKGTGVLPTTLDKLRYYDGVEEKVVDWAREMKDFVFQESGHGELLNMKFANEPRLNNKGLYSCEQWVTEKALTEYLAENGVTIKRGVKLTSFEDLGEKIKVKLQSGDFEHFITVKYLIASDGAKSAIRKSLGITYDGETKENSTLTLHFDDDGHFSNIRETFVFHLTDKLGTVSIMMPLHVGTVVYMDLAKEECLPHMMDEVDSHGLKKLKSIAVEDAKKLIIDRFQCGDFPISKVIFQTHFRVNNRVASSYWNKSNIFLLGDAAHSSTPAVGLGLNFGIEDALNLAWKLGFVVNGIADPKILESYDTERREHAIKQLHDIVKQNDQTADAPLGTAFRRVMLKVLTSTAALRKFVVAQALGLTFNIPKTFTVDYWGKWFHFSTFLRRMQYLRVNGYIGGSARFNPHLVGSLKPNFMGATAGFKAVVFKTPKSFFNTKSDSEINLFCNQLKQTVGISDLLVVDTTTKEGKAIFEDCGVKGQCVILVRPDGFVGLRSNELDFQIVQSFLHAKMSIIQ